MSTGTTPQNGRILMYTMHELLMPELIEMRYADRLAEAESRRQVRDVTRVSRRTTHFGRIEAKLHLPRLRRRSTVGSM
jgi:hypothetical protein